MKLLLLAVSLSLTLGGCSKVLSQRTDEQAWLEFDQEVKTSRKPASNENEALRAALSAVPVRSILLKCGLQVSTQACYQSALLLQFDEIFRKVKLADAGLKDSEYRKEQKQFLEIRSFDSVNGEVNRFHQSLLSGIEFKARERAHEFFDRCESEKNNNAQIERFDLFLGGITDMPKGVYSCLTSEWISSQEQLLNETSERLGLTIVSQEARKWIQTHQIANIYEEAITEIALKKSLDEEKRFSAEKEDLLKGFNFKASDEAALKEWSPQLRAQFAYSPVEQWILAYKKEAKK